AVPPLPPSLPLCNSPTNKGSFTAWFKIPPDTTDPPPNSPPARALVTTTPYSKPHLIFGRLTWRNTCHPLAPNVSAAYSSSRPCICITAKRRPATQGGVTNHVNTTKPIQANKKKIIPDNNQRPTNTE